jgi:hypothetical protein
MPPGGVALVLALLVALPCAPARAAEVSASVSSREVYVGMPFTLEISIENATKYETPRLPEMDGLQVLSGPSESTSSFTQIVNGRMTQRQTVTLSYLLSATRAGALTIEPITVVADGRPLRTQPIRVAATVSETGDLMFVEVAADRDTYYLGETVELRLEIWLRPFRDQRANVRFDAQTMFDHLNLRRSSWGVFQSGLDQVRVREALREDAQGVERSYYVYFVPGRITPQHTGAIAFDDVRILVSYPTRIRRARSFFDRGRWETAESRPLVGTVSHAPIRIVPPPEAGRPASFAGAVGRFDFSVLAKPLAVAVGDPVTLTLTVTDRTPVPTRMESLQPPALDEVPGLGERFRIPTDPLAGVVAGRRKTFTQTIRARDDTVTAIPSIAFSYFDPDAGQYLTLSSDPIPITVEPSAVVTMDDVVGVEPGATARPTELTEVSGGILANYGGADLLVSQQVFAPRWGHGAAVAVPPVAFAALAVGCRRARRLRTDRGYARKRTARRRARHRLREAGRAEAPRRAEITAQALGEYVADRCNLPAGALTSAEVVEQLRRTKMPPDLVAEVEALLATCEQHRFAAASAETDGITERAARCIERLQRERFG